MGGSIREPLTVLALATRRSHGEGRCFLGRWVPLDPVLPAGSRAIVGAMALLFVVSSADVSSVRLLLSLRGAAF